MKPQALATWDGRRSASASSGALRRMNARATSGGRTKNDALVMAVRLPSACPHSHQDTGVVPPVLRLYPIETHIAEKVHAYTLPRVPTRALKIFPTSHCSAPRRRWTQDDCAWRWHRRSNFAALTRCRRRFPILLQAGPLRTGSWRGRTSSLGRHSRTDRRRGAFLNPALSLAATLRTHRPIIHVRRDLRCSIFVLMYRPPGLVPDHSFE